MDGMNLIDMRPVPETAFEALRDTKIAEPNEDGSPGAGLTPLALTTSWARWPQVADGEPLFSGPDGLSTSVLFMALNWGAKPERSAAALWRTFHKPGHAPDSRLKNHLDRLATGGDGQEPIELRGGYMTDAFKLVPTASERELKLELRAHPSHVSRSAAILQEELGTCRRANDGVPPLVLALGHMAFDELKAGRLEGAVQGALGTTESVFRVTHPNGKPCASQWDSEFRAAVKGYRNFLEDR